MKKLCGAVILSSIVFVAPAFAAKSTKCGAVVSQESFETFYVYVKSQSERKFTTRTVLASDGASTSRLLEALDLKQKICISAEWKPNGQTDIASISDIKPYPQDSLFCT